MNNNFYNGSNSNCFLYSSSKNNHNNKSNRNNNQDDNLQAFLDADDPIGAEVVYSKEDSTAKLGNVVMVLFFLPFVLAIVSSAYLKDSAFSEYIEKIIPLFFIGFCLFLSLFVTFYPVIKEKKKKRCCTQPITAKIVDIKVTYTKKGHRRYHPTYKYYYGGKVYIVSAESSRGIINPTVGQEVQLIINTADPVDYFIEPAMGDRIFFKFGLFISVFLSIIFISMLLGLIL